jgi:two-component system chemotaxis sensor kinase CheA
MSQSHSDTQAGDASAFDMGQFHQVFFEETVEHLDNMEMLLLGIDLDAPDAEDLNAIFRAAHSIKGGSGTFGFQDLAEVTHELETLLDRVRKQELSMTREMVDALLASRDVLGGLLGRHRGNGDGVPAEVIAELVARLRELAAGTKSGGEAAQAAAVAGRKIVIECGPIEADAPPELRERLTAALAGLAQQGSPTIEHDGAVLRAGVTTLAGDEEIRESLGFVIDPARVTIVNIAAAGTPAPAADPGYGFFDDAPASAAAAPGTGEAKDPGYGFFDALPAQPAGAAATDAPQGPPRSYGRRATDAPDVVEAKAGRRGHDRNLVAAQSDATTIRVGVDKVDQLINLVGELVITQAMLVQKVNDVDAVQQQKLLNGMVDLERNTRDLQETVMSIRMMPMAFVFNRFPRMLRDLAAKLGKQIELKTVGEQTELDKGVIEKISDPMTHLVRNAVDHGIELPEARIAAGKPAQGTLTLSASHQGGNIVIEVADDGAGLSRDRILAKAMERGLTVNDAMSDQEVFQLIFEAGFSTAETVTDVSGRGVGMDVVKRNIHALGGRVEIHSTAGRGTCITVRLPLTLAILDGLSVSVGGEMFIVPLTYIVESLQPAAAEVRTVSGRGRVVQVRGEYLPLVALHEVFGLRPEVTEVHKGIVVILETEGRKTALFVDALVGQHQVVIKSLESNYRRVQGVSGATIMGDGRVALILDAVAIARDMQAAMAEAA